MSKDLPTAPPLQPASCVSEAELFIIIYAHAVPSSAPFWFVFPSVPCGLSDCPVSLGCTCWAPVRDYHKNELQKAWHSAEPAAFITIVYFHFLDSSLLCISFNGKYMHVNLF